MRANRLIRRRSFRREDAYAQLSVTSGLYGSDRCGLRSFSTVRGGQKDLGRESGCCILLTNGPVDREETTMDYKDLTE